ncbi:MAG: universal stress protein [Burkholderiaceae bacterium]|nr:universal stress protein [Burkholderiaceae bacterium]
MYKKILVPIDGSELSYMAVAGAASFAKPLGAEVVVMTVIEPYSYTNLSEYRPESIDQYDSRVKDQARERLEKARTYFDRMGVPTVECSKKSFSPSEAIIDLCDELGCDLIFMASHGRKGLAAVLLGSETQKVLTHSKVPVMVFR